MMPPTRVMKIQDGKLVTVDEPALSAINGRLADDFITDCEQMVSTWNKAIKSYGIDFELKLPHRAFHRAVGEFWEANVTPEGEIISEDEWNSRQDEWLPSDSDLEYLFSLMVEKTPEPGEFANWIAPPRAGINGQPVEYEYVKIHEV